MTLRRTGIARKIAITRGAGLRRTPAATRRGRPRAPGPTLETRGLVLDRAAGCCELCGRLLHDGYEWLETHSFHHRQPRGAGGTRIPSANSPANLLLLCGTGTDGCHGFVEAHRTSAEAEGWLVRRPQDPAVVPVTVFAGGDADLATTFTRRVVLTVDGTYLEVTT